MGGEGWVVRDEWWEMSGERWVVGDEMSVYVTCCMRWVRWVVWDVCVCDMLCERWMRWVVWDGGERWAMWDEWIKMSGVRWVVWQRLPRTTFTHSKAPNPHARKTSTQKCSRLILAQLPRTTHSKAPNPNARMTSTQNFRASYWHSYPEHSLHTASCQTRMPGRHQCKIFAFPIGAATPNTVYAQRRQTRMPGRHQRKIFASPIGTAILNTVYTQQGAKPPCQAQEDISAKFSQVVLAHAPQPLSTAPATQTKAAAQRR